MRQPAGLDAAPGRRGPGRLSAFISADWSKDPRKRSVHVAESRTRRIRRETRPHWDLAALLDLARGLRARGAVLIGVDLALGVPAGYWSALTREPGWRGADSFVHWLRTLDPSSDYFDPVRAAADWRVERPFFHVPAGAGGLRSFQQRVDGGMLRRIDARTGAKPLFAVSGIPGTVGSGTGALWKELIEQLVNGRDLALWPFAGGLEELLAGRRIVLAETYPGLAYAAALAETLPTRRLLIAKTKPEARRRACDALVRASWVRETRVDLGDLAPARDDEDAFDSLLTAAAVLRCALQARPLCDPSWSDEVAEGGMLLAGPVDPGRAARRFPAAGRRSASAGGGA